MTVQYDNLLLLLFLFNVFTANLVGTGQNRGINFLILLLMYGPRVMKE